jgi:hypothetical protein
MQHKNTPHLIRQTSPSSPPTMPRPIAVKKQVLQQQQQQPQQSGKIGAGDEDSAEEVIIVGSPQQQQPLTEQNVLKLMANKCKEFPSQNLLKSNPSSGYVLRPEKKNDDATNANAATDDWSDDEDDEDEDENNDEQLRNTAAVARRTGPFNQTGFIHFPVEKDLF